MAEGRPGTPILQKLFIHHTIIRLRLQLCTKFQISAMNRQIIGSGFEFLSAHQQVLQPFSAHKVYINWYIFMQISEKWPRVHVGNYPTLITEFASVKVHLICNQLSKI
jgi:hypothetical protein